MPRMNVPFWEAKFARNVARDRRVDAELTTRGSTVVRVWEHERPEAAADRVTEVLATARPTAVSASRKAGTSSARATVPAQQRPETMRAITQTWRINAPPWVDFGTA